MEARKATKANRRNTNEIQKQWPFIILGGHKRVASMTSARSLYKRDETVRVTP